ncbi:MAG: hypothetical protein Q8L55_02850 [Phycisphaerales bacterium]|nr:hypothetical protein [Phycisphaerales bacterium]
MTPRKAKDLIGLYFGSEAVNGFDPLWPETMIGVAPGAPRDEVLASLRVRLEMLALHPTDADAHLLARVLRSIAAQMIDGPGAEWTQELEAALDPAPRAAALRTGPAAPVAARFPHEPIASPAERVFRKQARALVASAGASPRSIAQLFALAEADGLPSEVVDRFLAELVVPVESDAGAQRARQGAAEGAPRGAYDSAPRTDRSAQRLWMAIGAVVTIGVVAFSIFAIVAITTRQNTQTPQAVPQPAPTNRASPSTAPVNEAPTPRAVPVAEGPPDGRIFARELVDALRPSVPGPERERAILRGIETLRNWWPRIDPGSRVAVVQAIAAGGVDLSQDDATRESFVRALRAKPSDPSSPAAVWHVTATAGVSAVLSRERELPAVVQQVCREVLAGSTGGQRSARRSGSTFDEAAVDALEALPALLLADADQPSTVTRAQADYWLTALRSATGLGGSADDAVRRNDSVVLDTVERLLTSTRDASQSRAVFEFASVLLGQARFREGDAGRDRVLSWLADTRLSAGDIHLITAAVATRSSAAGVEATMVLSTGATQAERDELRARYAEAWSRAANAARAGSGGTNADWFEAARAAVGQADQATGDLEQLAAASALATISQAASLRSRGLPAPVVVRSEPPSGSLFVLRFSVAGDGEWARRFLAESRTASARLGRIAEFEQSASPGPVDCEVLAEAALLSTGETRTAAQRAALKRTDHPAMVNAVLEVLPRVKQSSNSGEFLGQFTLAGALPVSSDRWAVHYRRALIERLLTLLAASNSTVAADRAAAVLAESWTTVAGAASSEVSDVDGPVESVSAAGRAYAALLMQIRQQVPSPTALIHPDALDRARAGRLLVAHGLPQAFAANQVSAVEALAVIVAAERPATADQCRSLLALLSQNRSVARSVAAQIRATEDVALRLWALRLGEPL